MSTTAKIPDAPPQRSIGRYKIIGRLGKGGMAEVLLTLHEDPVSGFKKLVVVKRVLAALEDEDPQFIKMFLDEARLAARLNHANVIQTYEVGQDGASPYMAMEFLEGQSLNVLQRRMRALDYQIPVENVIRIACDALEGLHYAHELKDFDGKPLGVIHRDVTPSNIFIKYDGTTKLVDFGIAKSATQREKTRAGIIKGKMAYMAPEQFRDVPITRAVDVWAMGVVIWETIACERLFRGKNDFETVQAVMKREVPKLSARRSDVPAELDALLERVIQRDITKRIQTAEDFKQELEELAQKVGKPLRRGDVAKMMTQLFSEAIEQNQKLVKDFVERTGQESDSEYLRFNSAGQLEVRNEPQPGGGAEGGGTPSTAGSLAAAKDNTTRESTPITGSLTVLKDKEQTVVDSRPAGAEAALAEDKSAGTPGELAEDEDEPRPVWHWIVLAIALLAAGIAIWYIVAT